MACGRKAFVVGVYLVNVAFSSRRTPADYNNPNQWASHDQSIGIHLTIQRWAVTTLHLNRTKVKFCSILVLARQIYGLYDDDLARVPSNL